jgi:histidinol-phosphate aminotransferase
VVSAELIFKELREKDILVRFFDSPNSINNFIRITIGTQEQMEELINKIKTIV